MVDLFLRDSNIIFAYLFGGLVQEETKPLSDVDLALYVKNPKKIKRSCSGGTALVDQRLIGRKLAQYETIDPAIVVSILHRNLGDFEKYKKAIIKYLSSPETWK